jgi:hypothetical protein
MIQHKKTGSENTKKVEKLDSREVEAKYNLAKLVDFFEWHKRMVAC